LATFAAPGTELRQFATNLGLSQDNCATPGVQISVNANRGLVLMENEMKKIARADQRRLLPCGALTKPRTGGAGRGLVIVQSIVEGHDGELRFVNREGGGLVATILLPATVSP